MEKHAKFLQRCLVLIPDDHESLDAVHTSVIYFCLLGLSVIGRQPEGVDQELWKDHVLSLLRTNGILTGFAGGPSYSQDTEPHLSSTFFCLAMLSMLGEDTGALPYSYYIQEFVRSCQDPSGNFRAYSHGGEPSCRHLYAGLATLRLLKSRDLDTESSAIQYVLRCQNYDGGFGEFPGCESHAGITFCCVASLALSDALNKCNKEYLTSWLVHRIGENGGFTGRPGKSADVCYSFWVAASLKILGTLDMLDTGTATKYLLCDGVDELLGGFSKVPGERADPLHTSLALAALSLFGQQPGLKQINPALGIVVTSD